MSGHFDAEQEALEAALRRCEFLADQLALERRRATRARFTAAWGATTVCVLSAVDLAVSTEPFPIVLNGVAVLAWVLVALGSFRY